MRLLRHNWWVLVLVLAFFMLLPLTAAAITDSQIIAILNAGIDGLVKLVKVAYCSAGVTQLCP